MIYIVPIIVLLLIIGIVFFIVSSVNNKISKNADAQYINIRQILGGSNWKMPMGGGSQRVGIRILYFMGTFMARKVRCEYRESFPVNNEGGILTISTKPHNIPKKTPLYKFSYTKSVIYKDYILYDDAVTVTVADMNLSNEKCNEILVDLNRACEMVERGEYQLT